MSELIVAKAGGTSNATAAAMEQTLERAAEADILVASAPGRLSGAEDGVVDIHSKVTQQLIAAHHTEGDVQDGHVSDITERFSANVHDLGIRPLYGTWIDGLPGRIREAAAESEDAASMLGERVQAEVLQALGFLLLDPAEAPDDLGSNMRSWRNWLSRKDFSSGQKYALIGNTTRDGGRLRTFGPGGSDTTAGYGSYGAGADLHLNLTDNGAKSTDPRQIGERRVAHIPHMLYEEGRELGRNGTGLLHPAAMVPLMVGDIPTLIRSTFDPDAPDTLLDNDSTRAQQRAGRTIALSLMRDVMMHRLHEPGLAEAVGRLAVFENEFARHGIALVDSQGGGVDGQTYFVGADKGEEARGILENAIGEGGSIVSSKTVHFLTLVGYQLGTRLLDYTHHLVNNWGMDIKRWQSEGHDFTHGRHSLRISLPSAAEAEDTLSRLHASLIETSDRSPVTWRDPRSI